MIEPHLLFATNPLNKNLMKNILQTFNYKLNFKIGFTTLKSVFLHKYVANIHIANPVIRVARYLR